MSRGATDSINIGLLYEYAAIELKAVQGSIVAAVTQHGRSLGMPPLSCGQTKKFWLLWRW